MQLGIVGHEGTDRMEDTGTWRGREHREGHDGTWEEERAQQGQ